MAWRLRTKLRKAPAGVEAISAKLEEFEQRSREVQNAPLDDKRRNELSWPVHKLHFEKNRYLYDMHYKHAAISKQLLDYLVKEKIVDGKLVAKWRKPGYERLCSLTVITRSNMNFRTVSVCRTPLRHRTGQIMPNVMTGCVSCASGDGGPVWWDDPVPEIVKRRIAAVDPGKRELVEGGGGEEGEDGGNGEDEADAEDAEDAEILMRAKRLRNSVAGSGNAERAAATADDEDEANAEILMRAKRLRESMAASENAEPGSPAAADEEEEEEEIAKRAKRLRASMLGSTRTDVREASEKGQADPASANTGTNPSFPAPESEAAEQNANDANAEEQLLKRAKVLKEGPLNTGGNGSPKREAGSTQPDT